MPIKALIRLALVCLSLVILSKPNPAPFNKQASVTSVPNRTEQKVEVPKPQLEKVATKPEAEKPKVEPQPERPAPVATPVQSLPPSKIELMQLAGIPQEEYSHVDYIVSKESSWNHRAVNTSSGATGLCQSLPAEKMATEGSDYMTNPVTQLKWCNKYAKQRYGGWYSAFAFWRSNAWW